MRGFLALFALAGAAWLYAGWRVYRDPPEGRAALVLVALFAVGLRAIAWAGPYVLSPQIRADMHRFLWDGFVVSRGFNPYQFSPQVVMRGEDPEVQAARQDWERPLLRRLRGEALDPAIRDVVGQIGNPEIPTCYPPLAELFFGLTAWAAPGSHRLFRGVLALLDLGVCLVVLGLLRAAGRPAIWVLFYAWCPLVIKDFAGSGHYDPLATLPTAAAVWVLMAPRLSMGRRALAGALLGLGIAAKLYPLVLVVVFVRQLGLVGLVMAAGIPALLMTPFLGVGLEVFLGIGTYLRRAGFHSSLFWVVSASLGGPGTTWARLEVLGHPLVLDGFQLARYLLSALYGLFLLALARRDDPPPARALAALLGVFLVSATAYPWYLAWSLPFAALYPTATLGCLAVTITSYNLYYDGFEYRWWYRALAYLPPLMVGAWEWRRRAPGGRKPAPTEDSDQENPSPPAE